MQLQDRSAFSHFLFLSGLLGLAAGMAVAMYQALLLDPILAGSQQAVPDWTSIVFFAMVGSSLMILYYASILDPLFEGWFDIVTGIAIIGQWGLPVTLYLSTGTTIGGTISFLVIVFSGLNVLVAIAFFGNYLRRVWPGPAL